MGEVSVFIFVESRYRVNRKRIKSSVQNLLKEQGIVGASEVSVAIVGDRKMKELNKKYRNLDTTTNVLSFALNEGDSMMSKGEILRLGDVIVSYPQVIQEASEDDVLVDDKIDELIIHGVTHLLGIHHE